MPPDDERWITKKLNTPGVKVDRLYQLDELQTKITGQWIRTTAKDGVRTWYRVAEITRNDPEGDA